MMSQSKQKDRLKALETQTQKLISDFLSWNRIIHWRQNSGAMRAYHKNKYGIFKERFIRFIYMLYPKTQDVKFSDIGGVLPDGRILAIEVKKKGEKPDDQQEKYLQMIRKSNGVAFWADSLETVQKELSEYIIHK
jgi:hypothetical protein